MLDPDLYDLVHTGTPGDLDHYARVCEGARTVLELGCGSGRVLAALAARGHEVTGIELDPGMLAGARRRFAASGVRAALIEGDMARFDLGQRFDRIIAPYSSMYCLLSPARLASCLASVRAHLAEDGRFVFDGYAADEFHERSRPEDYPDDVLETVAEIEHDGEALTVYEKSRWDRRKQRVDATYLYVAEGGLVRHEAVIGHRYLRRRQLDPLLTAAGLALVSVHGDFEGGPYDPSRGSLVVVARRKRGTSGRRPVSGR